jgi:hypothetical protein
MIVRFHIDQFEKGSFDYRVTYEGEDLYADAGLSSIEDCIAAAVDGLGQDAMGAEIVYKSVVSGTYPLASLALMAAQIAEHAENSTAAIEELLRQPLGD